MFLFDNYGLLLKINKLGWDISKSRGLNIKNFFKKPKPFPPKYQTD